MRIGFNARILAHREVRGLLRYTLCLLKSLSQRHDIELVLFSKEQPRAEYLDGLNAKLVVFDAGRETHWSEVALPKVVKTERIDVFHAPADRGLPLRKVCPMVVTVHDSYERSNWRSMVPTLKGRLWYWRNELANYFSDAVLTVSQRTRNDLIRLRIAPSERIHCVHLAPDTSFSASSSPEDGHVLARYGLRQPYVLFVGGYDVRKNVSKLVEAFESSILTGHQLVIAAEQTTQFHELLGQWQKVKRFPDIRFIQPEVDELPPLYRQSEFLVIPSLWESFGFPLVEAMASGTPVTCSHVTALPEIAGDAALLFDPNSVEDIANALNRMGRDSSLRTRYREKGFQNSMRFSWGKTVDETVRIYKSVAKRA
jgi:glycosyltransferase involved in cell wall biosynthesis